MLQMLIVVSQRRQFQKILQKTKKNPSFFVFVGLKDVLNDEDLQQLYNHCRLMKVGLLLLESSKKRPLLSEERGIIITDDLCELTENFEND